LPKGNGKVVGSLAHQVRSWFDELTTNGWKKNSARLSAVEG
jgi:hypothetical protein